MSFNYSGSNSNLPGQLQQLNIPVIGNNECRWRWGSGYINNGHVCVFDEAGRSACMVRGYEYCRRGYFRWKKISRKCWQNLTFGNNFHDTGTTPIFLIKSNGSYFRFGKLLATIKKEETDNIYFCKSFSPSNTFI